MPGCSHLYAGCNSCSQSSSRHTKKQNLDLKCLSGGGTKQLKQREKKAKQRQKLPPLTCPAGSTCCTAYGREYQAAGTAILEHQRSGGAFIHCPINSFCPKGSKSISVAHGNGKNTAILFLWREGWGKLVLAKGIGKNAQSYLRTKNHGSLKKK